MRQTRDGEGEVAAQGYMCSCQERSVWNKVDAACVQAGECAGIPVLLPANCVNDAMDLLSATIAWPLAVPELEECMCLQKARAYAQCQSTLVLTGIMDSPKRASVACAVTR